MCVFVCKKGEVEESVAQNTSLMIEQKKNTPN